MSSGALWKSCRRALFIGAVIILYFYFRYCLYHIALCTLNSGCGDRAIILPRHLAEGPKH